MRCEPRVLEPATTIGMPRVARAPAMLVALPVRTGLIDTGADLPAVVGAAVRGIARAGDVLAVSETVVAITEGRFIAAETVWPSKLAYVLARRAGALATVNQPESMQIVIDLAGRWRVLYAALMQIVGRLFGRRGAFYEILGATIAQIDGYTGTLPPFDRMIVLGPADPDATARAIAAGAGVSAVIVDANDLSGAKVLGSSGGIRRGDVEQALRRNPHGNGDEQTPIVVLKWRGAGRMPLFAAS